MKCWIRTKKGAIVKPRFMDKNAEKELVDNMSLLKKVVENNTKRAERNDVKVKLSDLLIENSDYDKNYNKVLPYTTSLIAMKIIANLLEVSECPLEHQDRVKGKIAVLLNTELFKYSSLVERQGSAALIK